MRLIAFALSFGAAIGWPLACFYCRQNGSLAWWETLTSCVFGIAAGLIAFSALVKGAQEAEA